MDFKESLLLIKEEMNKKIETSKVTEQIETVELSKNSLKDIVKKTYSPSEKQALKQGFEEVEDAEAYNGRYFVKNGKIWIHNIEGLKHRLEVYDEEQLRSLNYDVDTYYELHDEVITKKHVKGLRMYDEKERTGTDYGFDNMVYMSDGVYIHKDDCWW